MSKIEQYKAFAAKLGIGLGSIRYEGMTYVFSHPHGDKNRWIKSGKVSYDERRILADDEGEYIHELNGYNRSLEALVRNVLVETLQKMGTNDATLLLDLQDL